MKKIIFLMFTITILLSCKHKPFVGRVVHMEYIMQHMCCHDDIVHSVKYYVPIPINTHKHKLIPSEFVIYAANKDKLIRKSVDSLTYTIYNCGDLINFK